MINAEPAATLPRRDASRYDAAHPISRGLGPAAAGALLACSFVLLYWQVVVKLVHDWATDDNYSHGFFIVPLALFFAWERRAMIRTSRSRPSVFGLLIILGSLCLLVAGVLGAELFLTRVSMIGVLAGTVLFCFGWGTLKVLSFPVSFLLLMVPIPSIVFNQVAFPLQLLASRFGESVLYALHIPVLREGNVIILANTTLEVAQACSGIRSLVSLLTLGIVYGYFIDKRITLRAAIALATVPVAIVTNGLRVAGTGIAAHYYGAEAAQGVLHESAGIIVFVSAFAILFGLARLFQSVWPNPAAREGTIPVGVR